ncbi:MAG TPA: hypothetical protein VIQ97_01490, partial [Prevotella sp.]
PPNKQPSVTPIMGRGIDNTKMPLQPTHYQTVTNCHSSWRQPWHLVAPTAAVGGTKCGSWLRQLP